MFNVQLLYTSQPIGSKKKYLKKWWKESRRSVRWRLSHSRHGGRGEEAIPLLAVRSGFSPLTESSDFCSRPNATAFLWREQHLGQTADCHTSSPYTYISRSFYCTELWAMGCTFAFFILRRIKFIGNQFKDQFFLSPFWLSVVKFSYQHFLPNLFTL